MTDNKEETSIIEVKADRILAQIVRIKAINPIKNADRIIHVEMENNSWTVVVSKSYDLSVGKLAVYFCLDAILPQENEHFKFLKGKALETETIRGALSQGLVLPLSCLPSDFPSTNLVEGFDVTKILGVTKGIDPMEAYLYESAEGKDRSPFPRALVPVTDEIRLQDRPTILEKLRGTIVVITRKEEGCSATYIADPDKDLFLICGRSCVWNTRDDSNEHYFTTAESLKLKEKMFALGRPTAIQGEIVGPKINGNRMQLKGNDFKMFYARDINEKRFYEHDDFMALAKKMDIKTVPVLHYGKLTDEQLTINWMLDYASKTKYESGAIGEGIVVKTIDRGISFKVISNKFLAKYKRKQ